MNRTSPVQTQFLSVQDVATIVTQVGTADTLRRMADYIQADYMRWPDFDKCARVAAHSPEGVIELMPIADAKTYTFKYVNGHPKNTLAGLSTVMAFGVLADVDTGRPELLSELTLTTALRTAAMSAVAARTLARPNSKSMALIGNGAQSEFQALAFHHLLGIEDIRLFDTDPVATQKLVDNLQHTAIRLTVCTSIAQAVRGADIVTTVTADKTNATILTPDLLEPGMHINGVGGDCPGKTELHPDMCCAALPCLCSTSRKPASKAICSTCPPTLPSPSCGKCWWARRQAARRRHRLRCLIRLVSPWKTTPLYATCAMSPPSWGWASGCPSSPIWRTPRTCSA